MNARKATAPAKAATETAPAALTFEDAAVPDTTRAAKPNPYAEVVGSIKGSDTAKAVTLPSAAVPANVRLMQQAGKAHGVTVRNRQDDAGNGSVKVTFWTVARITRPRKDK